MLPRVALIACGCFSPPTPMHMRLFGKNVVYESPVIIDIDIDIEILSEFKQR